MAGDILDTFARHAGLVTDATDTDCWARNNNTYGFPE